MTVPMPDGVQLPSVTNLRDMGGIATASGQRVAPGRLWRSSHFAELTPSDAQAVEALGLRCVIDLRGAVEREKAPSRLARLRLREVHLPIEPRAMGALRDLRAAGAVNEQALVAVMAEVYRRFVLQHAGVFATFLRLLGDDGTPLPLVFHCTHRTHGVGMIDVADVVDADAAIAGVGARPASFLIGTVSHCHGALRRLVVG